MVFWFSNKKRLKELEEQLHQQNKILLEKDRIIQEKNSEIEKERKKIEELELEKKELLKRLEKETIYPLISRPSLNNTLEYFLYFLNQSKKNYLERIKGTEADIIVFTHRDGDGICCGALIQRIYGYAPDFKIFHIGQSKRDLILSVNPRKKLITADIVLNEKLAKHFLELQENGVEVICIDHHTSSLEIPENLLSSLKSENILIWEKLPAATSVVRKYYELEDKISRRICLIGERCDGDISERTFSVKRDARILNKLKILDESVVDRLRNDLSKYGYIKNKKFKKLMAVSDLLVAYSSRIVENSLFYDSKNFQVYYVKGIPLVSPKVITSRIFHQTRKDVYLILENGDSMFIRGISGFNINNILSKIAFKFDGVSHYTPGFHSGGCELHSTPNVKEIVKVLEDLYKHENLVKEVYNIISSKNLI